MQRGCKTSVLCESVAKRLREHGFKCHGISVTIRDKNLFTFTRQKKLTRSTQLTNAITKEAYSLFLQNYNLEKNPPVRALTVSTFDLRDENECFQLDLFDDPAKLDNSEKLNHAIDSLQSRFGTACIKRAFLLKDQSLTSFDPYEKHIIHPVPYFK